MGGFMFSRGLDRETRLVTYTAVYLRPEETLGKLGDSVAYRRNKDDKVKIAQSGMLLLILKLNYRFSMDVLQHYSSLKTRPNMQLYYRTE